MNIINHIKRFVVEHKIWTVIIILALIGSAYEIRNYYVGTVVTTSYVTSTVKLGTIISSVNGTGQVSASNQVDLKTKTSGDITYLNAKVGQEVSAGQLIAQVDSSDAAYELESAKLSYDKLITVDPDALRKAENAVTQANTDLKNAYINTRNSLASTLTSMSDVVDGLAALFDFNTGYLTAGNYGAGSTARDFQSKAESSYYSANNLLNDLVTKYRNITGDLSDEDTELFVANFYNVSTALSTATKDAQDAIIYLRSNETKNQTKADSAYTSIISLVSKATGIVSSLSTSKNSISNNKISLENSTADLQTLKDGPDTISLRSQQLVLKQKQETLSNYSVIVPFTGVIAATADINVGDTVSSGATIATLITKQKIAEISLNEIDAAKVKVGQKANLTFDAVDGLNITGTVAEVNLIGTVSQGVVSYTIKISFDTQDDRVKSGMSVVASIITEAKTDVLMVPGSAVKTQGTTNFVEVFEAPLAGSTSGQGAVSAVLPKQQTVTIGISNDTSVEILTGLTEGQTVVIKTITTTGATTATTQAASISSLLGGNRGGATNAARGATGSFRPGN